MKNFQRVRWCGPLARVFGPALLASAMAGVSVAYAGNGGDCFLPGKLLVSRSVYDNNPRNVHIGETLPPNCGSTTGGCSGGAGYDGTYPTVFNNALIDGSFGITSKIFLDQITARGSLVNSLEVPNSSQSGVTRAKDQMVTSFSSKSELALNLSTNRKYVSFMGYVAPINAIDVSNSNTPGAVDPTNPVGENVYRAVARVDQRGNFEVTKTNAYSGNNGRAAILNDSDGRGLFYMAGNAGNGSNPQPDRIITEQASRLRIRTSSP